MTLPVATTRVLRAEFRLSAPSVEKCPEGDRPEVAFVGRSNCGKSSLINALARQKTLARTSRTPGRTQLLNVFDVDLAGPEGRPVAMRWVDLPGYGFAKGRPENFAPMIEGYLRERRSLRALVVLVDLRRGVVDLDLDVLGLATGLGVASLVVGTKADKLPTTQRGAARKAIADAIGVPVRDVALTSASAKSGLFERDGLLVDLLRLCEASEAPAEGPP